MCCLTEKFDLLLILKSRVLQSFKGYHASKFVCLLVFWVLVFFGNLNGLFHLSARLSRDFLSSHNTSAKGLIVETDAQNLRKIKRLPSYEVVS